MTLERFVEENRDKIDEIIISQCGKKARKWLDDDERENWVLNDEGLYRWAISEGCDV